MTRVLKTSGFLGLAVMMVVGLYQHSLSASGGAPSWMVGGHAHLGVLSIMAVALGVVVDVYDVAGRLRTAVSGLYVAGQWLLPVSLWVGVGFELFPLLATIYLWGLFLLVAMLLMAYHFATGDAATGPPTAGVPADD